MLLLLHGVCVELKVNSIRASYRKEKRGRGGGKGEGEVRGGRGRGGGNGGGGRAECLEWACRFA